MLQANAPVQLVTPFAQGATGSLINAVPLVPYGGQPAGQTAYSTGFTITNFTPIASGGIPPWGADMNGLLNAATLAQIYLQAGYVYPFNATFSSGVGGYPNGARVAYANGLGTWISTADSNTTNPDTTANANWVPAPVNRGVSTVTGITGGTVTLTKNELGAPLILLEGTLTSNATVVLGLPVGATYTIQNLTTGAFTLTVGGTTGSTITLTQGSANGQTCYCDGTNWYTSSFSGAGIYLPIAGTAVAANKLATARTISATGAVVWSVTFDGSANVTAAATLGASGVTAGTYGSSTQVPQLTVGTDGRITGVTNVTVSVTSVFGRTGAVVLTTADLNGLGAINLTSNLTVNPSTAPAPTTAGKGSSSLAYQAAGAFGGGYALNDGGGPAYWGIYDNAGVLTFGLATTATAALVPAVTMSATGIVLAGVSGSNTTIALVNPGVRQFNIIVNPSGSLSFNDATAALTRMSINSGGAVAVGSTAMTSASLTVTTSGATYTGSFTDTGTNGAGVGLFGNGSTTPNKYLRCTGGALQVVNNAYSAVIWSLSDAGAMSCATGTFTSSDATLKHAITPVEPRPFHRLPRAMVAFTWNDEALGKGLGTIAQDWLTMEPLYVARWNRSPDQATPDWRLTVDKASIAYEQAMWGGRAIDGHEDRLTILERQVMALLAAR